MADLRLSLMLAGAARHQAQAAEDLPETVLLAEVPGRTYRLPSHFPMQTVEVSDPIPLQLVSEHGQSADFRVQSLQ